MTRGSYLLIALGLLFVLAVIAIPLWLTGCCATVPEPTPVAQNVVECVQPTRPVHTLTIETASAGWIYGQVFHVVIGCGVIDVLTLPDDAAAQSYGDFRFCGEIEFCPPDPFYLLTRGPREGGDALVGFSPLHGRAYVFADMGRVDADKAAFGFLWDIVEAEIVSGYAPEVREE